MQNHEIYLNSKDTLMSDSLNKAALIDKIAEQSEMSKADTKKVFNATIEVIKDSLASNKEIRIIGFGNFTVRSKAERKGMNPTSGQEITIPAQSYPWFKAGTSLKETVKENVKPTVAIGNKKK